MLLLSPSIQQLGFEPKHGGEISKILAETSNCYELFESIFLIGTSLVSMPTNAT